MAKIAVCGFGTVGSGTVEVLEKNKESLEKKAGQELSVKYIVDIKEFPDSPYKDKLTKSFDDVLNDDEVTVVAELIGGAGVAYRYTKAALEHGKSVVTSNKELVSTHGAELLQIAKEHGVNYFFEASVGGGIPIIKPLHQCLSANQINGIAGILNGTTNYILTKMWKEGSSFDSALKKAQELGYAEGNPTADIEGHDTCRKICILASLAFGRHVYPEGVHTEGITKVTYEDMQYCESFGGAIKLIGFANREGGDVAIGVCPAFVSGESQLYAVNDVFNAILVEGDATGTVVFYGKGAGKLPTASAVVSDIVDAAKSNHTSKTCSWQESEQSFVLDWNNMKNAFYIRMTSADIIAAKKEAERLFGEIRFLSRKGEAENEAAFITEKLVEREAEKKLSALSEKAELLGKIRVLDF